MINPVYMTSDLNIIFDMLNNIKDSEQKKQIFKDVDADLPDGEISECFTYEMLTDTGVTYYLAIIKLSQEDKDKIINFVSQNEMFIALTRFENGGNLLVMKAENMTILDRILDMIFVTKTEVDRDFNFKDSKNDGKDSFEIR